MIQAAIQRINDWKSRFLSYVSDRLDQMESENSMESMDDISRMLFNNRNDIMGQAGLALIEKKYGHLINQEYCSCPLCDRRIRAMPRNVKREIKTLIGPIELHRPYFYCKSCHHGFYPLDEALGLSKRKIQPDIQELEAWLAAEMPFEIASETFKRCTGIELSDHHIHDVTNSIANNLDILDISPTKEEINRHIDTLSENKFRRPVLMIGLDGAHAPTRPEPSPRDGKRGKGEWREVKGFRMYLLGDQRITHLVSWHQIETDKELAADLKRIKDAGLIPEEKVRICVIGDGAPWIWNRMEELYPDAKMVLDYYHCAEYLHDLAHAQYGKDSREGQEWIEATHTRLFCNRIDQVIAGIKCMNPSSEAAGVQIEKTVRYLSERKEKAEYGSFRRGGYHIGSGGIESSNKFIANVRLKRSGAWWYPTNANNILKLRCAKYNGTFDRIMENLKQKNNRDDYIPKVGKVRLVVDNS